MPVDQDIAVLQVTVGEFLTLQEGDQLAPPGGQQGKRGGVGGGHQELHVLVQRPAVDPAHLQHRPGRAVHPDRRVDPGDPGDERPQIMHAQVLVQAVVPLLAGDTAADVAAQCLRRSADPGPEHHGAAAPGQGGPERIPGELRSLQVWHGERPRGRLDRLVVVSGSRGRHQLPSPSQVTFFSRVAARIR